MSEYVDLVAGVSHMHAAAWLGVALLALIWLRLGVLFWLPDRHDLQARFAELNLAHRQLLENLDTLRREVKEVGEIIEFRLPQQYHLEEVMRLIEDGSEVMGKSVDGLRIALKEAIEENAKSTELCLEQLRIDLAPPS